MAIASSRYGLAVNPLLTSYAYGLVQQVDTESLAEFVAPTVNVGVTIGRYKKFDDANAFQVYNTERGIGGSARRILFSASDGTYNCKPQALEVGIDDAETQAVGEDSIATIQQAKTKMLVNSTMLSHEDKVLSAVKAGLTAVGQRGNWSNPDVDPIDQLNEQITAIVNDTGIMPTRMVMDIGSWNKLRNNPKVKSRVLGIVGQSKSLAVDISILAGTLLTPNIQIRVATLVKSAVQMPGTQARTAIIGSECWIYFANSSPSTYDPSFAHTFRGSNGAVDAVRVYRDESCRSDILAVDWSEDIQVVSTLLARRLTIT